jgi:hypothetical protein
MKEMKPEVREKIENWYKNVQYGLVHFWEQDDTWFVIVKHSDSNLKINYLDFARIFPSYRIKGEYHISVDKTITI